MVEVILLLQWVIALGLTGYAARTDLINKQIYDGTTLLMIIVGLFFIAFSPLPVIVISLGLILLVYLLGLALYKKGYAGGGDVKLMMGIQAMLPTIVGVPSFLFVIGIAGVIFISWWIYKGMDMINATEMAKFGPLAFASLIFGGVLEWFVF